MARVITDFKKNEPSYETFNNEEEHPDKIKYVNKLAKDGKFTLILRKTFFDLSIFRLFYFCITEIDCSHFSNLLGPS